MKKVLLATSILAASAGFASAEVTVSGKARMGMIYDGDNAYFSSRVRVTFDMTGETDGGLSFGASVRADQSGQGGGFPNVANNDSTVYISGAFGKLTFGDVDSAANALVGDVSAVGFTGLGSSNELTYLIGDYYDADTSMLYEYTSGALSFALSSTQLNTGNDGFAVAVKYSTDAFGVALGYEDVADYISAISLGGSATFGAATVKVAAINYDQDQTDFALSVDYVAGAATITAFYKDANYYSDYEIFGLGAAYDLGGGAAVKGGLISDGDEIGADVGVTMSF